MTAPPPEDASVEAAAWHAQVGADTVDWDGFGRWLEADPAHQAAYEEVALIDAEVSLWGLQSGIVPANDVAPAPAVSPAIRHDRRRLFGYAIAATLVVAIAVPVMMKEATPASVSYAATDAPRLVPLGEARSARLERGSRLEVDGARDGHVTLARGAAYFDIRHDPARTFVVAAGDVAIRDIGTRFAVSRDDGGVRVAVAEGVVGISWRGSAERTIRAGQSFSIGADGAQAEVRTIDRADVAPWREGRLVYDGTPLKMVAADLARYGRITVSVDPTVADLKLSGILLIEDGTNLVGQVQALLPVVAFRQGDHILLTGRRRR